MAYTGTYGHVIRAAREAQGLSQEDLATALKKLLPKRQGLDNTAISKWENQSRRPTIEEGNAIVTTLRLNGEEFWRAMGASFVTWTKGRLPDQLIEALLNLPESEYLYIEQAARGQLALLRESARLHQ